MIPYAADRDPDSGDRRPSRPRIPIISEEESRAMEPDYYLVAAWHFLEEFLEREREDLDGGGPLHRAAARGADDQRFHQLVEKSQHT